jgi:hypothetical protein
LRSATKLALANAIAAGRITPAEKADWATKLAADWDENSALRQKKARSKRRARSATTRARRMTLANTQAAAQFRDKVATKMANTKCLYAAGVEFGEGRDPALFEAMDAARRVKREPA